MRGFAAREFADRDDFNAQVPFSHISSIFKPANDFVLWIGILRCCFIVAFFDDSGEIGETV